MPIYAHGSRETIPTPLKIEKGKLKNSGSAKNGGAAMFIRKT